MKLSTLILSIFLLVTTAASASINPGLNYSYYEGTYAVMPDFNSLKAAKTGASSNLDVSIRGREVNYAILWQGYITIPASGTYTFETNSDDGSLLFIGQSTTPVVNNDGHHAAQLRSGSTYLAAGVYPVSISFFNACCAGTMELYWSSNTGISRQRVPDQAFSYAAIPQSMTAGLDYSYYEGTYAVMPNFSTLKAAKTGASSNLDVSIRGREVNYAILWQGYITIPASGTYTFETNSDDGSLLFIGQSTTPVVNNDGHHAAQLRSGSTYLAAGVYPVSISFFNACCAGTMELYWSSNTGISRQRVPDQAFSHEEVSAPPTVIVNENSNESGGLTGTTNYYFSSSTGDDTRSSIQAQNPNTPWKSLARLNGVLANASAGTAVLLKRGDTFDGSIRVASSGTSSQPIIISAYGTGSKPVINGFASSANWTSLGNGVWEAPLTTSISKLNMVVKGNQVQGMGRYPNITDFNKGYLTFEAHSGSSTIVDYQLPAYPNWTGAELVIRKNRWTIDRGRVTYHNGNTISQQDPSGMDPIDGFGYFIQNDPRTLDQLGEWYYNAPQKKVQVFTGGGSPASYGIKPSVIDTLITIRSRSYITMDNISFQGANSHALAVYDNANYVTIQNCLIDFTGVNAIAGNFTRNLSLLNSEINHTNNNGLYLAPYCWNTTIKDNTIKNTGLIPGLGASNNQAHEGMTVDGAGSMIRHNFIDSTGYIAIAFTRDDVTVINNFVSNFALTTDDGAGIYTHDAGYHGRRILNNIVLNGKGSHEGTDSQFDLCAQGIGTDDMSTDVEITGNTVANCSGKGIGLHNSQFITVSNNTSFNNKTGQLDFEHDMLGPNSPTRNVLVNNNILFAKTAEQSVFTIFSKEDDVTLFGTADNNYYCRPMDDNLSFHTIAKRGTPQEKVNFFDLSYWKGFMNQDQNSKKSPYSISRYSVHNTGINMISNSNFDFNIAKIHNQYPGHTSVQFDNTVLDGGALKVSYTGSPYASFKGLTIMHYDPSNFYTLLAGHNYRIKFSIKGSLDNNTDFFVNIRSASAIAISDTKTFKVHSKRSEVELLFTPTTNIPSTYLAVWMNNADDCPTFWMDNLKMEEVSFSPTNPDDFIRFEYNTSTTDKTVALDGEYIDVKNNIYAGSITLAPYTSAILMKKTNSPLVQVQSTTSSTAVTADVDQPVALASMSVKVSPNPATSNIQLTHGLQLASKQAATVTIHNASGAVVKTFTLGLTSQPVNINVADLKAGVYTVKLDCNNRSTVARFVKM